MFNFDSQNANQDDDLNAFFGKSQQKKSLFDQNYIQEQTDVYAMFNKPQQHHEQIKQSQHIRASHSRKRDNQTKNSKKSLINQLTDFDPREQFKVLEMQNETSNFIQNSEKQQESKRLKEDQYQKDLRKFSNFQKDKDQNIDKKYFEQSRVQQIKPYANQTTPQIFQEQYKIQKPIEKIGADSHSKQKIFQNGHKIPNFQKLLQPDNHRYKFNCDLSKSRISNRSIESNDSNDFDNQKKYQIIAPNAFKSNCKQITKAQSKEKNNKIKTFSIQKQHKNENFVKVNQSIREEPKQEVKTNNNKFNFHIPSTLRPSNPKFNFHKPKVNIPSNQIQKNNKKCEQITKQKADNQQKIKQNGNHKDKQKVIQNNQNKVQNQNVNQPIKTNHLSLKQQLAQRQKHFSNNKFNFGNNKLNTSSNIAQKENNNYTIPNIPKPKFNFQLSSSSFIKKNEQTNAQISISNIQDQSSSSLKNDHNSYQGKTDQNVNQQQKNKIDNQSIKIINNMQQNKQDRKTQPRHPSINTFLANTKKQSPNTNKIFLSFNNNRETGSKQKRQTNIKSSYQQKPCITKQFSKITQRQTIKPMTNLCSEQNNKSKSNSFFDKEEQEEKCQTDKTLQKYQPFDYMLYQQKIWEIDDQFSILSEIAIKHKEKYKDLYRVYKTAKGLLENASQQQRKYH